MFFTPFKAAMGFPLLLCALWALINYSSCANSVGREFALSLLQNYLPHYDTPRFQLFITAVQANTKVTVTVPDFKQERSLNAGEVFTVNLPPKVEVYGSVKTRNTVRIHASADVSVTALNYKQYTADTSVIYPVTEWGKEYFIFTPPGSGFNIYKEFSVTNGKEGNSIEILTKGLLSFQNRFYKPGDRVVVDLQPFESIQLQSDSDLSGTSVVSELPFAVFTGHSCSWRLSKCDHVYEQLLPVSKWGSSFIIPPLSFQKKYDSVYLQASQPTKVTIQQGTIKQDLSLSRGQTKEVQTKKTEALSIHADHNIQVLLFFNGVTINWFHCYDPFLMTVMSTNRFCSAYSLEAQEGFENKALIVAQTGAISELRMDGKGLPTTVQWKKVSGSEFSWAEIPYKRTPTNSPLTVSSSGSQFGLYSIGVTERSGYGSPAQCLQPASESFSGTCWAMGDPHYHTFDGLNFNFMGTCSYVIAKNCGEDDLPAFEILAQNENRGSLRVSYVTLVTVKVYDVTISVARSETGRVRVDNSLWSLPITLNNGKLIMSQSGRSVLIETDFGLTVSYDWEHHLVVTLSSRFTGKTCGLCGNFNGNPSDDFTTPSGTQAEGAVDFAKSWKVPGVVKDPSCKDDCEGGCEGCKDKLMPMWEGDKFCGLITLLKNGPFSKCNAVVDPQTYLENCKYDVCMGGGLRQFLCRALEVYADACQAAGVQIQDWRKMAKCAANCPANSHYELCGSACPATCSDPNAPSKCKHPCVDTCTCNTGFVLSGNQCVQAAKCGCIYQGRYVPAGESFWTDQDCQQWCNCVPGKRIVECQKKGCGAGTRCQVVGGIRKCQAVSYSTCKATGDPHYTTFDKKKFDFQGTCVYQLVALCSKNPELEPFEVRVQNDHRGSKVVAFTKLVEIKVYSLSIVITKTYTGRIMVNNELNNLPITLAEGQVSVYKSGSYAVVTTNFGLKVSFNWLNAVFVTLPSNYMRAVCGLCGNYNNKAQDDLIPKNGDKEVAAPDFGSSWRVAEIPGCVNGCEGVCPDCDINQKVQYEKKDFCGILKDPSGPFSDCHAKVDPTGPFEDCVYDVCLYKGRKDVLCQAIEAYTSDCHALGAKVHNWRTSQFCAMKCPVNSHYEICANGCPATCKDLAPPPGCLEQCAEGCSCGEGYILSGDACVPFSNCGCVYDDRYYSVNQVFYPSGQCKEKCMCKQNGEVECKKFACGPNEKCKIENGIQKCHPEGKGVCHASGDPHYRPFDGQKFDFQGTCTYTLSKSCGLEGTHLVEFAVQVENVQWNKMKNKKVVAVTKMVAVQVYDVTVIMRNNMFGVLVNRVFNNLPLNLNDGAVLVYQEGKNYIVSTNFGLIVTYDLVYHVTVTVPGNYRDKVCGLCGNFNGNKNDDFQMPDNQLTEDVNKFGKSWKVTIPNVSCGDGCEGHSCPKCDRAQMAVFSKPMYCGAVTAPKGPFAVCHGKLDPKPYFDDCVFDVCASDGDGDVLCNSIAAYAFNCHNAGVDVKNWRTSSFCPMKCPANSHYEDCTDNYSTSCPGLTEMLQHSSSCTEGCECDTGFLFNGQACVKDTECGCYGNGKTFKPGETVYEEGCNTKCTCDPAKGLVCEKHSCPENTKCLVKKGIRACYSTVTESPPGTCWAMGDPHYHTFDGQSFDFMGTCTYVIAKKCDEDDLPVFEVLAQNENRGSLRVSYVALVTVKVYDVTITVARSEGGRVRIDNSPWSLPITLNNGKLIMSQSGRSVLIETDFGLTVSYDWEHHLVVTLSSRFTGKTCGLCGNFNGNPSDDFTTPSGTQAEGAVAFAKSWKVPGVVKDPSCKDDCEGGCEGCKDKMMPMWEGDKFCGLITLPKNGPFSKCHAVVDPQTYLENCKYDVCMGGGLRQFLCRALEVYADACQAAGVQIQDWRKMAKCAANCPANSHYELCGSACPATCSDPNAPSKCKHPCVDTCTCNTGFVLSGNQCVPAAKCGCLYEGRYVPAGESFWADQDCQQWCKCVPGKRIVECQKKGCGAGTRCQVVGGIRKCQAVSYSTCKATGDPHYTTFDKKKFDFQGTCVYQLVALCSKNPELEPFEVRVQNDHRGSKVVAFTKLVEIKVYSLSIVITKTYTGRIMVNNELNNLPITLAEGQVSVYKSGSYAVVTTNFGLKVSFNWLNAVFVTLPSNYMGAVCGLCGNYNNKAQDDLIPKNGDKEVAAPDFGSSWRVAEIPGCVNGCEGVCPDCDINQKVQYEKKDFCGILKDPSGPFRDCHAKVDPTGPFEDCVYDVCLYKGRKDVLCQAIEAYTSDCHALGAKVHNWRTSQFCAMKCPVNSQYEICANGCPATCKDLAPPPGCLEQCAEGCSCGEGYILSGDACVPFSNCGCVYDDRYYSVNQVFYPSGQCKEKCMCKQNGEVECKKFACGPNEKCKIENGIQKCHPEGKGVCHASGDPHYRPFDGQKFDFQGTCTYTLSKSCGLEGTHLVEFAVQVENVQWNKMKNKKVVAVTKMVAVQVYDVTVIMRNNMFGVLVNGVFNNLPLNLNDGAVLVYQEGKNYIVSTNFGLIVTYDLVYHVTVTVPGNYRDKVCGLCGNFNGNKNDDFQMPDNQLTEDVNKFGKSWKVTIPNVSCGDGCEGHSCPKCDRAQMAVFSKPMYCGAVTAPKGPFAVCHGKLDPKPYFDDCVFDVCASDGDGDVLCNSIAAYAFNCHNAGVDVKNWRTSSFCPMKCPANSHYEDCTDNYSTSCPGLTEMLQHSSSCTEGCECDTGFLFNGQACVKDTECGCYGNGKTFKPGETVYEEGCNTKCTCDPAKGLVCEKHSCPENTKCLVKKGIRACYSTVTESPPGTCWAMGDPHYHTFDGQSFDFMGTCTYVIAKKCDEDDLPVFEVLAQNENRGSLRVSYVALVTVKVYDVTITVARSEGGRVRIDNSPWSLPITLNNGKLIMSQSGRSVLIETDFGLTVSYDWEHHLVVTLSSRFTGKTCGLCGNFNGNPSDDFTTPSGTQAEGAVAFAKSWKVPGVVKDPSCKDDCEGGCEGCKDKMMPMWEGDKFCGLITLPKNGPFSKCHAVVDPQTYLENCKYDVCMGGGLRQFLCRALEVYADACQAAGVQIQDWRKMAKCAANCPANSHYELCGSACPATCSDPNAPSKCKHPCVDTCTCNTGFVLSGNQCVPAAKCGCLYEGRYVPAGESFWADQDCQQWCKCVPGKRIVECQKKGCGAGTRCQVVGGIRKCQAVSYSTCKATGDPHYTTFDKKKFDFQGTCVYQLVALCSKNPELEPFEVRVQNDHRGSKVVAFTKLVEIKVYSLSIVITKTYTGRIMVNNELNNLPITLAEGQVSVYKSGSYAVVTTNFGLKVSFNWLNAVFVTLPSNYMGAVCGLCGNYNNKAQDDLIPKNGDKEVAAPDFGSSWRVAEIPGCVNGCEGVCPDCDINQKVQYEKKDFCGILKDPSGPFRDCHAKVDPTGPFEDCVYDVCLYKGRKDVLCQAIEAYTSDCHALGAKVHNWRTSQFCAMKCPVNSQYEICANGCPATCKDLAPPPGCLEQCAEGCSCGEGYILSGDACVPFSNCGCVYDDRYYSVNQVFYPSGQCKEKCMCKQNGEVECKKFACGPNEKCKIENGIQKCHPEGKGVCHASGDPHYRPFDGQKFDFQGTCTYTLSKSCGLEGTHLVEFAVQVENVQWNKMKNKKVVAVTKMVAVQVYDVTVIMRNNMFGVLVNGVFNNLPLNLNDGAVLVYQEGKNYIVSTNFGLIVTYDLVYHVTVTVPGNYRDKVCGLCGNFNGNKNDDFQMPDNQLTEDVNKFGKSWKVTIPNVSCGDGCEGHSCPKCDRAQMAVFSKPMYCGAVTAPKGPFAVCHGKLDPKPYFDDCVFDVCASDGDGDVLCNSIAAYAFNCHNAGVDVKNWRTSSFCPMKCPANSHYEDCTDNYSTSCPGLTEMLQHSSSCTEGCECDTGFLFNGQACVKDTECGCYGNGKTFKPGETVYEEGCNTKCTCDPAKGLVCEKHSCPENTKCLVKKGIRACYSTVTESPPGTCWAMGDPHYHTFDGQSFDFMGTCTYVIAKKCDEDDLPVFEVLAQNENRGSLRVSYVALVTVKVYDVTITVARSEGGRVRIDNSPWSLPITLNNGKLIMSQSGRSVLIETDFGLTVSYDWEHHLVVTLSSRFTGKTCGLCGNFNGNPSDDFTTPSGTQAEGAVAFAKSWKVPGVVKDPSCKDDCEGGCEGCKDKMMPMWEGDKFCGLITLPKNGPFSKCHAVVDPQTYLENCKYDVCMGGGLRQFLCRALEVYADACQAAGVQIQDWRKMAKCAANCPANSHYELCGSACPATCSDPNAPSKCKHPCVDTCTCNTGFVLSGNQCVPAAKCGCLYEGRYVPAGESFWADQDCQQWCKCVPGKRIVECQKKGCGAGTRCQVVGGIRKCQAVSYSTCKATGDPHYTTFDKKKFDFQGTCVYQLVALCSKNPELEPFEVRVQNDHRGSKVVAFTKLVEIKVYSLSIVITKTYTGRIMVNNELNNLPITLAEGQVSVYKSGSYAVVTTNFGLKVSFNWLNAVFVTLPSNYMGAVCGLCGNYNNKAQDDLIPKNGDKEVAAPDFGSSWHVAEIPGCVNGCEGVCPDCDINQKVQYEKKDFCGILKDPSGPFRDCHAKVDPTGPFEDCVYDVCLYKGRKDVLCQAIEAYTSDCHALGAKVHNWRTSQFCAMKCPVNSHYEICANGCPATCKDLAPPPGCLEQCAEGCSCGEGYILSGDACVPFSNCGCVYDDRYYSVNQVFYPSGQCKEKCMCKQNGEVECKKFACGPNEKCKIENGIQKCHPEGKGVCHASGDPHYRPFDGQKFDFQGTCTYTLSKSCGLEGTHLVEFAVQVENVQWNKMKNKKVVAVTKMVAVQVYDVTVIMRNDMFGVMVNGVFNNLPLNLNDGAVLVYQEGKNYIVSTNFGLIVTYDLVYHVTVTVPGNYRDKVCGLCGNFNGNKNDDFRMPGNKLTKNVNKFGKSWKVTIPYVSCGNGCKGNSCPKCDRAQEAVFSKPTYCGAITAPKGPFVVCHGKLDPKPYFDDCVFDLCASNGDGDVLCNSVAAYAFNCHNAGVDVKNWRTASFCPMKCPANSHYEVCADSYSASCPGLTEMLQRSSSCTEGCECDMGFLFNGQACVTDTECGCYENGKTYKPDETVYEEGCDSKCTCNPTKGLVCKKHSCDQNTKCLVKKGIRACYNTDPCKDANCRVKETCHVEKGEPVCVPQYTGKCWAWGDPHYRTFDGLSFDFQGTCKYVISKTCGKLNGLVPFSITERNDNRGNTAVSYVREVEVSVHGFNISILKNQIGQATVDGELLNLPIQLGDGQVSVIQSGHTAVIETHFGLVVSYDWNWELVIKLPSSYYDSVCGLCGNFNGNKGDELQDTAGKPVSSVTEWGKSWKTPEQDKNHPCSDACKKNCPTCDDNSVKHYETEALCGALTEKNGMFKKCHGTVDPEAFMHSCVYDMCLNKGDKKMLCQALASYSKQCREGGITIQDWRKKFGCPMNCQPHSHYEDCAKPCQPSCPFPEEKSTCAGACVETCVCDKGYVLSAGVCVPAKTCGCSYQGRYYKPGQHFWADKVCRRLCECDTTLGMVTCRESSCSAKERCTTEDGERACRPISHATCSASGDPHYHTFDDYRFDFQGTCVYQLAGLCSQQSELEPFKVTVQNDHRGSKAVSYTRTVTFSIYGVSITTSRDYPNKVLLNEQLALLPLDYRNELMVSLSGRTAVVETKAGITVTFDWQSRVSITLPSNYQGAVCGLCGNYNGNNKDDLTMPNGRMAPNGAKLGESWQVAHVPDCSSVCQGAGCQACSDSQREEYQSQKHCGIIADKAGPFRECHSRLDPAPYLKDCVYDACYYRGHHGSVCDAVGVYVSACQSKGIKINSWRTKTFCPMACPANSHYALCATGCPATCASLTTTTKCRRCCSEGCECDEGYMLSGGVCVPVGDCGCSYDGRYYRKGDVFYPDSKCAEKCVCGDNSAVSCQKVKCQRGETCNVENGVNGCHQKGQGKCVASGDPHYISFDGKRFDFQGTCVYVLAKVCNDDDGQLTAFTVTQGNEKYGNGKVAVTKSVAVAVYGFNIYIQQKQPWMVTVDDELLNLPLTLGDGLVIVTQEGRNIVVRTDFGLTVLYDTVYYVEVIVPSTYSGKMCGLCGNYNKRRGDDFTLPNGKRTRVVDDFGKSWVVDLPGYVCGGCGGQCPKCKKSEEAKYRKYNSCGVISSRKGPFKACHGKINPGPFLSNCVYDMCAANGDKDTLCSSVQAYALACQGVGVKIQPWRSRYFCPASCPPHSHYEVCADTCGGTCASFVHPFSCSKGCFEGCQCDSGYVFDGIQCVQLENCGCVYDGKYLKVGQVLMGSNCKSKCVCQSSGRLTCEKLSCASGEVCRVRDGVRGCHAQEGRCSISPLGQLHTFDGVDGAAGVHGAFEAASLCDESANQWFRVVVDVRACEKEALPAVVTVYVFFEGHVIAVNSQHVIWVNGRKVPLPRKVSSDLMVRMAEKTVVIERASVVRVTYSFTKEVNVIVHHSLSGKMCGACGNYNKDVKDDMKTADGKTATDVSVVVGSWIAGDFSQCGLQ